MTDRIVPLTRPKRQGTEQAHIDQASYVLLVETLIGFLELCIKEGDHCRHFSELERLTNQLQRLADRHTPPKGVA
ncbi:hypothetical protein NA643_15360 [Pseudomonas stutzeri]|uniref:hypothetical protein n=1 Tax=Stutzerimonas stutzeri TaxID=316 RepID=UPI000C9C111B|nr:hypothetical protein [Stutzerimonas stutzeri]MCQ4280471.1 hypothetical protein [Stutzerimonas stutzeri]PNF71512.1 hypothetical protein CXK96_16880 [Stutzerimonas stutzeri]